ncbi:hypothetical protein [Actinokineospora iranica]|uniref:Uncharacterized protein n=1 Tax=Actinokineospora iranica TaxID=1271860 RepID=A0A1G6VRQ7_9PSEU|nr:hypothetical protein [Actinokineospora iranica]SDD56231.1 hypothetical protein SAMN05216174_11358 [Actinokineospora iranica]
MTSVVMTIPDVLDEITAELKAGRIRRARALGRKLLDKADLRDLWLLRKIADVLEHRPYTAADILRGWMDRAPEDAGRDCAIIRACLPEDGEIRHRPRGKSGSTRRYTTSTPRASRVVTTQKPNGRKARRTRRKMRAEAEVHSYQAERAGVAEGEQIPDRDDRAAEEQVYASGVDFDRAALYGMDTPYLCLTCTIGRGRYDLDTARVRAGRGDDGLCAQCRENGRRGVAPLPTGHTDTHTSRARCWYLFNAWACEGDDAVRAILRAEWKHAPSPEARDAVVTFVAAHLAPEQEAPATTEEPAAAAPLELAAAA